MPGPGSQRAIHKPGAMKLYKMVSETPRPTLALSGEGEKGQSWKQRRLQMCQMAQPCRCAEALPGAPSLTGRGNSQVPTAASPSSSAPPVLQSGCPPTA